MRHFAAGLLPRGRLGLAVGLALIALATVGVAVALLVSASGGTVSVGPTASQAGLSAPSPAPQTSLPSDPGDDSLSPTVSEERSRAISTGQAVRVGRRPVSLAADPPSVAASDGPEPIASVSELNPAGPKDVDPRQFRQLLPLDAIRPIYDPLIATPDEVTLDAGDLVIGVSIGGESRAYPIRTLRFREIVNDEVGGTPVLVTW